MYKTLTHGHVSDLIFPYLGAMYVVMEQSLTNDSVLLSSMNRNMFQYAGTKDRRAKTTQEVTVYR